MNADLNIIFRMSRKEGREFEGAFIKYFTSKGGHYFEGGDLLGMGAISTKCGIVEIWTS